MRIKNPIILTSIFSIACYGDISVIEKEQSNEESCESLVWYWDADGDGYGGLNAVAACEAPEGYVESNDDCKDNDAEVYPNAPERCNQLDDDCDNQVDEDLGEFGAWYLDIDSDGFGDPDTEFFTCTPPENAVSNHDDCDDQNELIHPDATDDCNGVDDNCNGLIDDDSTMQMWFEDDDLDSYGNPDSSIQACAQPQGYVLNDEDCDDNNAQYTLICEPSEVLTTCSSTPYTATGTNSSYPELHVLSAYEPDNGTIFVHISRNTQMTVLLSSYEPVHWVVTIDSAAIVDKILINGYHSQTVTIPSGIPYEIRSYDQTGTNFGGSCGYSLPYNGGGCDTNNLLNGVQAYTGLSWSSFTGCYTASGFLLQ